MEDDVLCYVDSKQKHQKRVAVPRHLQEGHAGGMGGHFSGRTYVALVRSWWWDGMHADTLRFVRNCPACSIVWWRKSYKAFQASLAPYPSPTSLPNYWSRHYEST